MSLLIHHVSHRLPSHSETGYSSNHLQQTSFQSFYAMEMNVPIPKTSVSDDFRFLGVHCDSFFVRYVV